MGFFLFVGLAMVRLAASVTVLTRGLSVGLGCPPREWSQAAAAKNCCMTLGDFPACSRDNRYMVIAKSLDG